ncbi:MAG: fatty acid desaturase [Pseudomonadota bacterium]
MQDLTVTRADLRAAIPAHCFKPNTRRSLQSIGRDYLLIGLLYAGLFYSTHWLVSAGLIFLIGTLLWATFVIGHEAGHGSFSTNYKLNTVVGLITHSIILVPYRPWQRSHFLHHKHTGHLKKEEVFRAVKPHQDNVVHKAIFRTPLFLLFGWPLYLLGFRNQKEMHPIKFSHFTTVSDLFSRGVAPSYWASLVGVALFGGLYFGVWATFGFAVFFKFILAPYLCFAAWLTFVTYMQHVSPEVPVYDAEEWTGLKGALATVDRNYFPFNQLTHRIGDCHVIHHLFANIPHYHAKEATQAIKPLLGEHYLSSPRSVIADFYRTLIQCHFVEREETGEWRYRSANKAAPNYSEASSARQRQPVPAE